jgi:hypothetical protein
MDENQNSMSKHTNNTPFVVFGTKNERNDQRKKKTSSTLKNKILKNNDLTGNKMKRSVGY